MHNGKLGNTLRTLSEKRLIERRRSNGILVPMIEALARDGISLSPETEEDADWVRSLILKSIVREKGRESRNVISPSALSSCLRLVHLRQQWQRLGLQPLKKVRTEAIGYFAKGNFTHLQWQFVLWKLAQYNSDFKILEVDDEDPKGFEVYVNSKKGDHGGTVDTICSIFDEPFIVDIKGWNIRWFQDAVHGNPPGSARIQLSDYLFLGNSSGILGNDRKFRRGVLLVESKGGPTAQQPLALTEVIVPLKENKIELKARLGLLRTYEKEDEIPPPECQSTGSIDFQGCPFSGFCREEVKEIQERRRKAESSDPLKVARPSARGVNRARRVRPKR
jgi:hypothetical protein